MGAGRRVPITTYVACFFFPSCACPELAIEERCLCTYLCIQLARIPQRPCFRGAIALMGEGVFETSPVHYGGAPSAERVPKWG